MAEIAGKYNISLELKDYKYQFTGNDRSATVQILNDVDIDGATCTQQTKYSFGSARAKYDNVFNIKRARIISSGAEGLRTNKLLAAYISFCLIDIDSGTIFARLFLKLNKWNEWQDVDASLRPFETPFDFTDPATLKSLSFRIGKQMTKFFIDDFNIQSAYIGQYVTPVLNFEIETAGMVWHDSSDNYSIF